MGLSARWQAATHYDSSYGRIEQDSYALVGGFVSYDFTDSLSVSANLDNVTDEAVLQLRKVLNRHSMRRPRAATVSQLTGSY